MIILFNIQKTAFCFVSVFFSARNEFPDDKILAKKMTEFIGSEKKWPNASERFWDFKELYHFWDNRINWTV